MEIKSLGITLTKKEFENMKVLKNYHKILSEKLNSMKAESFEKTFQVRRDMLSLEKQIKKLKRNSRNYAMNLIKTTIKIILVMASTVTVAFLLSLVANWLYQ